MNVNFEHSSVYLSENEEQRLSKSLILFDKLLESVKYSTLSTTFIFLFTN